MTVRPVRDPEARAPRARAARAEAPRAKAPRAKAPRAKDVLGRRGEEIAARWLVRDGLVVLARNWRGAGGELDIVARDGPVLVVCEVKTRSGTGFGTPVEAVTPGKAARLRRLAGEWLRGQDDGFARIRIDVVGILWGTDGHTVRHVRDAA